MRPLISLLLGFARADGAITLIASADRPNKLHAARATAVALPDTYRAVGILENVSDDLEIVTLTMPLSANSVAPAITGTAQVGQVLTTTLGTWSHSPTLTRQWKANGVAIAGATGATYTVLDADTGKVITCVVTAQTASGFVSQVSNSTAAVTALAVNTVAPAITGTAQVGQVLTTTNGTWTHSPTFARQWKADAVNIGGETGLTYTPVVGDIGKVITCLVTATTAAGNSTQLSNATAAVIAA